MDNYQKVEQLVNKTGCSYEDAKAALEGCGWDMLDAVISLEREGKIKKESAEETVEKKEEAVEIIPEITVERGSGHNSQQLGPDRALRIYVRQRRDHLHSSQEHDQIYHTLCMPGGITELFGVPEQHSGRVSRDRHSGAFSGSQGSGRGHPCGDLYRI